MTDTPGYSPRHRVERVVCAGRLVLATFLCVGLLLDPFGPGRHAGVVQVIAVSYFAYALGLAAITWRATTTAAAIPVLTHVVDLVLFSVLMHLSESPTSPFFVYFVFATLCGAIRWHGRGALVTGTAALAAYVAVTIAATTFLGTAEADWLRITTRCAHLATVAGLLAYLGAHQHRLQREIGDLARWPRRLPASEDDALKELLVYAARTLRVPRLVLVWEEGEEPGLRVASLQQDRIEISRERPDRFKQLVAERAAAGSFLCNDVLRGSARVLLRTEQGFFVATGSVLSPLLQQRYQVRGVLGARLAGDAVQGWLFALDRPRLSADDLLLGDIVARLVTGGLDLQLRILEGREAAAGEERLRLARELHDGVLQALTAASLQIQRAKGMLPGDVTGVEQRLACVQDIIYSEQQAIRHVVERLNPRHIRQTDAVACVRECASNVGRQWDLRVDLRMPLPSRPIPQVVLHELCQMVTESLVNAARHGGARQAVVECHRDKDAVSLAVEYEGQGFAGLSGRYDLRSLDALGQGPRTLKERVTALAGSLVVDSRAGGARLEITIPLPHGRS